MSLRKVFGLSFAVVCSVLVFIETAYGGITTEAFKNPPNSAKPHTWFHMMNGNVTKEGITRDFEEIAKVGLGGVQMFDAGCNIPAGGLDFNSPAWFDMFNHAASEAQRLGLEICIPNCSGWSSSGGPWNPPANGMKKLTHRTVKVTGPKKFSEKLPRETCDNGFYADVGVFAHPTPSAENVKFENVKTKIADKEIWFSADEVFEASGFSFKPNLTGVWFDNLVSIKVEISADGKTFIPFGEFKTALSAHGEGDNSTRFFAFPKKTGMKALHVKVANAPGNFKFLEARLERGMKIPNLAAKMFAYRYEAKQDHIQTTPDQVIAKKNVRDLTAMMKSDGTLEWDVPAGEWTIHRIGYLCTGRKNHPASDHGEGLEVDKLSADALNFHFDQYVARLCKTLGSRAGNVSAGFNNILVDSYEVGSQNWTQKMETEFERRTGYSIRPFMPVFAGAVIDDVETTERFLEDFRRVVADMFAEYYAGALAKKCHEYGLKCSIEPYGNSPSDDLQYGEYCDIPMGEFWSHADNPYAPGCGNTKFASYVTHVWGKKFCGTESFTTGPGHRTGRWLTTPFSIKAQGDIAYANGANRIIYHRFAHQPCADDKYLPGMTMGRYGMHLDRTQTWWDFSKPWFEYQTRCQYLLQEGTFCADVLFFIGEHVPNRGIDTCFGVKNPPFFNLPDGYDHDICPTDAMYALKVENGCVIVPGGVKYRVLALPAMEAVSVKLLECVTKLRDAGATIVWQQKPVRAFGLISGTKGDAKVRELADALWMKGLMTCSPAEALNRLAIDPDFNVSADNSKDAKNIEWLHRRDDNADWYFVAMPNREETTAELSFRQTGRIPEIWDAETGDCREADVWREENGRTFVTVPFGVCGSKFVVFRTATKLKRSEKQCVPKFSVTEIPVTGAWNVKFPNQFLPNKLAKGAEEVVIFNALESWSKSANEGVKYFSGTATYEKTLPAVNVASGDRIELDLGEVKEFAEVTVNGKMCGILWKPPFRIDITDAVKSGAPINLSIRVANLWANRLIGDDRQFPDDCEWNGSGSEMGIKSIPQWVKEGKKSPTGRSTFTTWKHWKKDDELLPSGILGPVCLYMSRPAIW